MTSYTVFRQTASLEAEIDCKLQDSANPLQPRHSCHEEADRHNFKCLDVTPISPYAWARETLEQSIEVLTKRMSAEAIQRYYYADETAEDYADGDNAL